MQIILRPPSRLPKPYISAALQAHRTRTSSSRRETVRSHPKWAKKCAVMIVDPACRTKKEQATKQQRNIRTWEVICWSCEPGRSSKFAERCGWAVIYDLLWDSLRVFTACRSCGSSCGCRSVKRTEISLRICNYESETSAKKPG